MILICFGILVVICTTFFIWDKVDDIKLKQEQAIMERTLSMLSPKELQEKNTLHNFSLNFIKFVKNDNFLSEAIRGCDKEVFRIGVHYLLRHRTLDETYELEPEEIQLFVSQAFGVTQELEITQLLTPQEQKIAPHKCLDTIRDML